jgi:hypothetical protein
MINEKLLWHTGEQMLAEHVQRAVAVRSQNSIALSSQRSPGPIELARCLVWSAALAVSTYIATGKPMIVVAVANVFSWVAVVILTFSVTDWRSPIHNAQIVWWHT